MYKGNLLANFHRVRLKTEVVSMGHSFHSCGWFIGAQINRNSQALPGLTEDFHAFVSDRTTEDLRINSQFCQDLVLGQFGVTPMCRTASTAIHTAS